MFETLLQSSYFSLFLIIALGFMLGRIKIKGLSLDVSAVIFIALLFGHFGVVIPKSIGDIGLVLFIFTIGTQSGPGFFDSFKSKGKVLIAITLLIVGSACLTGVIFKYIFGIDTPSIVGLIAGALTSTPGLAVAIDSTKSSSASIAYGIAYPFGVIGVILFIKLLPKVLRLDLVKEAKLLEEKRKSKYPELNTASFRITNPLVFNKTLAELQVRAMTGAVVSRIKHDDHIAIPTAHTVLHEGDMIKAVGNNKALDQLTLLLGELAEGDLPLTSTQELQSLLLTNKNLINKSIAHLNLQGTFGCTVTRVRRSGIDLSPEPDLVLKFGDKLMVAGEKEAMKELAQFIGNDENRLSDTDFFPIATGIVLGVIVGKLSISLSDSFTFSPGLTGGVLLVALILSAIGKTGPILWSISASSNQLLRQLGLLLFLSEVGTSAGVNLVSTFVDSGITLFAVGLAITVVPMIFALVFGYYIFKINILDLLGTIAGGMTSTPGLAAADSMSDSNAPSVAYATVYPIAMVFLIIFIQVIAKFIV
ncbi:MAG: transporter [Tannerellaceae bacterium]|nr:transporter [Tannerellaceae bacterium]